MDIDIRQILREHNIPFITSGKNVHRNNIAINCPYCNGSDPSMHLGIDPSNGWFACWRNDTHSGKNIKRLLYRLGIRVALDDYKPEVFEQLVKGDYFTPAESVQKADQILTRLPKMFVPISSQSAIDKYYLNYIKSRGFDEPELVVEQYHLMRCKDSSSKWYNRLIIPTAIDNSISWTGRSISAHEQIRYLSPKAEEARNIKHCIFNYNDLKVNRAKALVITEGPLDAIKADYFAAPEVRFTCLYGVWLAQDQIDLIAQIYKNYDRVFIALDKEFTLESIEIANRLSFCNCQIAEVISEKDPGAMNEIEVQEFVSSL